MERLMGRHLWNLIVSFGSGVLAGAGAVIAGRGHYDQGTVLIALAIWAKITGSVDEGG